MLNIKVEILVAKEYNENIVFRDNWPLYGIYVVDDIDIKEDENHNHTDGHIAIVSDFDEDYFSWNYMISALKQQFEDKLKAQAIKYETELDGLKQEIQKIKGSKDPNANVVKYEINESTAEQVKLWLDSNGMSMYYDIFVKNGFDSIKMLKEINNRQDLCDIGVNLKAHQYTLMNAIVKLKQI